MATLPPVRPEDQPLQDDVRRLGAMLGESITALSGPDAFADVELLRALCRQRRSGSVGPDSIVALLHGWDTPRAEAVVRAFSLYFRLINTAEQTHRVRRRHAWQKDDVPAQRGSLAETVSSLQAAGVADHDIAAVAQDLELRPVFTAHPTESMRRTTQDKLGALHHLLLRREQAPTSAERDAIDVTTRMHIASLWQSDELKHRRPTVLEEVRGLLDVFDGVLWDAAPAMLAELRAVIAALPGDLELSETSVPLRLGSWMGGDRDGNPYVTAEVTLATARLMKERVLLGHLRGVREVMPWLSQSTRHVAVLPALLASIEADGLALPAVRERNAVRIASSLTASSSPSSKRASSPASRPPAARWHPRVPPMPARPICSPISSSSPRPCAPTAPSTAPPASSSRSSTASACSGSTSPPSTSASTRSATPPP